VQTIGQFLLIEHGTVMTRQGLQSVGGVQSIGKARANRREYITSWDDAAHFRRGIGSKSASAAAWLAPPSR